MGCSKLAVSHSAHGFPFVFYPRTPKALDNTAQGCEATLGWGAPRTPNPNGVALGASLKRAVCNPFGVDGRCRNGDPG